MPKLSFSIYFLLLYTIMLKNNYCNHDIKNTMFLSHTVKLLGNFTHSLLFINGLFLITLHAEKLFFNSKAEQLPANFQIFLFNNDKRIYSYGIGAITSLIGIINPYFFAIHLSIHKRLINSLVYNILNIFCYRHHVFLNSTMKCTKIPILSKISIPFLLPVIFSKTLFNCINKKI